MKRNVELLERTMQFINDNPQRHYQGQYFVKRSCGTACCFAGWALLLGGMSEDDIVWSTTGHGKHIRRNTDTEDAWMAAKNLLGLEENEWQTLFHANNTGAQLQLMVKDLVNGDVIRPLNEYRETEG